MTFDLRALSELLPAFLRLRDAEIGAEIRAGRSDAAGRAPEDFGPLTSLLSVIAEQVQALEEDLTQLYDDQFIETCASWVVPYLGDLIGAQALHETVQAGLSSRAEVARTIPLRRRKGTIAAIESLAASSTGWPVIAVEFFQRLATTQHLNRLRLAVPATVDLRDGAALELIDGPFDHIARNVDVGRISTGQGRHNIPNIGVFLWRITSTPRIHSTPFQLGLGDRRFLFHPLGRNLPLYRRTAPKSDLDARTAPEHLPMPISRWAFHSDPAAFYGPDASLCIFVDGEALPGRDVQVCNLADLETAGDPDAAGWQIGGDPTLTSIDPELGRFVLATGRAGNVTVRYHAGAVADLGGGEYDRSAAIDALGDLPVVREPGQTISEALAGLGGGAVLLDTSETIAGPVTLTPLANSTLMLVAGNHRAPVLTLPSSGVEISAAPGSTVVLDGLLITGGGVHITPPESGTAIVVIRDCTLVPGRSLHRDGSPFRPDEPSLVVNGGNVDLLIERSILGGIRGGPDLVVSVSGSIIDARSADGLAFGGIDRGGGRLAAVNTTVIGRVHATSFGEVTNCLFVGRERGNARSVFVERRQEGCVRFSFVPLDALVPRRYRCPPETETAAQRVRPAFTSLRYGDPGYAQLSLPTAAEIRHGADDESEMGAYHDVQQRARITNLRVRLSEFLPVAMEAGICYAS